MVGQDLGDNIWREEEKVDEHVAQDESVHNGQARRQDTRQAL